MQVGRKLAGWLAINNIKHKEFAQKIGKHPVELCNYINGKTKQPAKEIVELIVLHTNGYIQLSDWGY